MTVVDSSLIFLVIAYRNHIAEIKVFHLLGLPLTRVLPLSPSTAEKNLVKLMLRKTTNSLRGLEVFLRLRVFLTLLVVLGNLGHSVDHYWRIVSVLSPASVIQILRGVRLGDLNLGIVQVLAKFKDIVVGVSMVLRGYFLTSY